MRGEGLDIIISNQSGRPLYEQIASQIKGQILSGKLPPGEMLPSMRLLAKELRISVITTKRAYEELERDGFIATVTGKGSFVTGTDPELVHEEHLRRAEEHLQQAVEVALSGGITKEELHDMLDLLYAPEEST